MIREVNWKCLKDFTALDVGEVNIAVVHLATKYLDSVDVSVDLPVTEKIRAERFHHLADRNRFKVGRILLRQLLGQRMNRSPADAPISLDNGRPFVSEADAGAYTIPHFNLSHSGDTIVLAWSEYLPLGIDVETCRPISDMDLVAQRVMDLDEREVYFSQEPNARFNAFYTLWVKKEAILKQLQTGFSLEPRHLHVGISPVTCGVHGLSEVDSSRGYYGDQKFYLTGGCFSFEGSNTRWSLSTAEMLNQKNLNLSFYTID